MHYILERLFLVLVHNFFLVNYQPLVHFYYTSIVPHTHITFNGTNFTPLWMKLICWKEYFLLVKKKTIFDFYISTNIRSTRRFGNLQVMAGRQLEGYPGYPRIPQYSRIYFINFSKNVSKSLCINIGYPNIRILTSSLRPERGIFLA